MTDDVASAQRQLGRAFDRARMGEDRQLATEVREKGEQLAMTLHGLLRMSRIHAADNKAFDRPVEELRVVLERLVALLGVVHLATVEDQVYVNDIRVHLPSLRRPTTGGLWSEGEIRVTSRAQPGDDLGAELRRHNVGGLTFHAPLSEPEMRALVGAFSSRPPTSGRRAAVVEALARHGVSSVEPTGVYRFRMAGEKGGGTERRARGPEEVIAHAVALVDETLANVAEHRMLNPLPLRRVVSEMLGLDMQADAFWLEPAAGSEHARHAARVCRLALLIGRGLMLTDGVLQDLGIAALVHDIGYSQPGGSFATHTSAGVRVLLRQRGFQHAKVRRLLAVLHHHRDWDAARPPSVLGRILRVAEDYDALTRKAGSALSPALALARMCADPGRLYDPLSRQALVNGLGRYPPGTWLQLADGRVACVRAPATGELDKPRCYCGQDVIDLAVEGDVARVLSGPPHRASPSARPQRVD